MPITTTDFDYLASIVSDRTGNVLNPSQDYLVESRLSGLVRNMGMPSIDSLIRELRSGRNHQLGDQVAEAMTINETRFFRDPQFFETLKDEVLPRLIEARRSTRKLAIWCAASSSGQEPYSIAIILREHFPELDNWNVSILCTDYSQQMIERTENGSYTQFEVNRGLPADLLVKYFDRKGMRWIANETLKKNMQFKTCNLTEHWIGIPPADLVMLRNVLIYFDKPTKEKVFRQMERIIASDGYLFLGAGETTVNLETSFSPETLGSTPVYRPNRKP